MKSYIENQKTVKISDIYNKENSLTASDFKIIKTNSNMKLLNDLLIDVGKGNDMSENEFVKFKTNSKYLKTASLTGNDFLLDSESSTSFEFINSNKNVEFIEKNKFRVINKFDILYTSTGSNNSIGACSLSVEQLNYNFSSHIFKLEIKPEINIFYLFALLKNKYCQEACDLEVPKAGIMRRGGKRFLKIKIPFPTINNHKEPNKVEIYVSLLVQNIINKEEQIKEKKEFIDEKIYIELKNNQNDNNFTYSYPKISEIKKQERLDTGLYVKEFKKVDFLIKNYNYGFFKIPIDKFKSGFTPKIRFFNPSNKKYNWVTPTHTTDEGFYEPNITINMPKKNNINGDCFLIINRTSKGKKGEFVGISCFYDFSMYGKGQYNQGLYKINDFDKEKSLFLVSVLNSKIFRQICGCVSIGSKMKEMKSYDFSKLIFPNFPEEKQKEISELYYNNIDKNKDLILDNYLEKEKLRNKQIGIFQLNMEIFKLREILEKLIHKIVIEEKIEIDLNY